MPLAVIEQFINKPCEVGTCDCLQMIRYHLEDQGVELSEEFRRVCEHTRELFACNYPGLVEEAIDAVRGMLEEIPAHRTRCGDILILAHKCTLPFLGINAGNGKVLVMNLKYGCHCSPLHGYEIQGVLRKKGD